MRIKNIIKNAELYNKKFRGIKFLIILSILIAATVSSKSFTRNLKFAHTSRQAKAKFIKSTNQKSAELDYSYINKLIKARKNIDEQHSDTTNTGKISFDKILPPSVNNALLKLKAVSISIDSIKKLAGKAKFKIYSNNPVLKPGKKGAFDAGALGSMTVVKVHGIYHMYYEAWGKRSEKDWSASEYNTLQIGHAVSLDGIHWIKDPLNPVIPKGKTGKWDHNGTWDPFVIYENGLFKMWYGGGTKVDNWGYAVSKDGSHFKKEGRISDLGDVEDDHVIHDKKNNKYYMYYWNRKYEPNALFRASSPNEKDFNFRDAVHIKIKGEKYSSMYKFTRVFKEKGVWYMLYANFVRPHCSNSVTSLAVSSDGLHWTKINPDILHGQDAEILKLTYNLYTIYYGPSGYFDAKNCDIRVAIYNGRLKNLVKK